MDMRKLRYNGVVTSMDGSMNRYEAIGTQNGKIVFLGTSQEGLAQQWDETVDLKGAAVRTLLSLPYITPQPGAACRSVRRPSAFRRETPRNT